MKIAYFGFDLFYNCLEMLIESGNEIVKIFTCRVDGEYESNADTYAAAAEHGIEITEDKPNADMLCKLRDSGCKLMISAGYYYRIPVIDGVLQVNIHPSLLPVGRGPWPQPVAILRGLKSFGVTIHRLAPQLDSGDVLLQRSFEININENLDTLTEKTVLLASKLLEEFIKNPDYYWAHSVPQIGGEYWSEPTDEEMTFSTDESFDKIDRVTRAFYGYRCYMRRSGNVTAIKEAICIKNNVDLDVSSLFEIDISEGRLVIIKLA